MTSYRYKPYEGLATEGQKKYIRELVDASKIGTIDFTVLDNLDKLTCREASHVISRVKKIQGNKKSSFNNMGVGISISPKQRDCLFALVHKLDIVDEVKTIAKKFDCLCFDTMSSDQASNCIKYLISLDQEAA